MHSCTLTSEISIHQRGEINKYNLENLSSLLLVSIGFCHVRLPFPAAYRAMYFLLMQRLLNSQSKFGICFTTVTQVGTDSKNFENI